jgi:hypothetical protein
VRLIAILLASLSLCACAAPQPTEPRRQTIELAGRTAGAAQHCINIVRTQSLRVSGDDQHMLLYGTGRTIWANDLGPGCGFSVNDLLVTQSVEARYCRGDVVRSFDSASKMPDPSCLLGDFVPFTR